MTVNAVIPYAQFSAFSNQVDFDINFTVVYPTELLVFLTPAGAIPNDASDVLDYGTDYIVEVIDDSGATITLAVPATVNDTLTVVGNEVLSRASDFGTSFPYTPDNINAEFDNIVIMSKQVETVSSFSPRYQFTDPLTIADLLLPQLGPNQTWGMNSGGTQIVPVNQPGDDPGAAQLRADLLSSAGAGIVGTTSFATVQAALDAIGGDGPFYSVDSGAVNTITVAFSPAQISYTNGELLLIVINHTNTIAGVTLKKDALSSVPVLAPNGAALVAGNLLINTLYAFVYDAFLSSYRALFVTLIESETPWTPMYISGIECTAGIDADHDVIFGTGFCRDLSNVQNIIFSVQLSKRLDAVWAVGNNAGGRASEDTITAGATFHKFIICKPDGTTDAGFNKDITGEGLIDDATASGFTTIRRVDSGVVDAAGNWVPTSRTGDVVSILSDFSVNSITTRANTTTPTLIDMICPTGFKLVLNCFVSASGVDDTRATVFSANYLSAPNVTAYSMSRNDPGNIGWDSSSQVETNTLAQIGFRSNINNGQLTEILVTSWIDKRDVV